MDLPKSKIGVDIEHGFEPEYVVIHGKNEDASPRSRRRRRTRTPSTSRPTPIARARRSPGTSPRRSGRRTRNIQRVLFNEITKKAVQRGASSIRGELDQQQVRVAAGAPHPRPPGRLPDLARCCGRRCSAACRPGACSRWRCASSSSASARSRAFKPEEYWTVEARLEGADAAAVHARGWSRSTARRSRRERRRRHARARRRDPRAASTRAWTVAKVERKERRKQPAAAVHHLAPAAGGGAQAALPAQADDGARAAALRRRRARRRGRGRSHHLHAHRLDAHLATTRSPTVRDVHRRALRRRRTCPTSRSSTSRRRSAQDAHEAIRPTSMKYDPGARCAPLRSRARSELRALHADLEPLRRLPDGAGGLRSDHRRHRRRRAYALPRHRPGHEVRRLHPRSTPRRRGRRTPATTRTSERHAAARSPRARR